MRKIKPENMKVGDLAVTKCDMGHDIHGNYKSGSLVKIVEVRQKKDGFTKKNYLVEYQDGHIGCWTRWKLKKVWVIK